MNPQDYLDMPLGQNDLRSRMIRKLLNQALNRAISKLMINDIELIEADASEWSISHRLALYLDMEFPGWNVDCEYNRQGNGHDPKRCKNSDTVRPDIIIHRRQRKKLADNLMVIEIKKCSSDQDHAKLEDYTSKPKGSRKFQYEWGVAVEFTKDGTQQRWFKNGKKL